MQFNFYVSSDLYGFNISPWGTDIFVRVRDPLKPILIPVCVNFRKLPTSK
jgi:hypothetical protein